MPATAPASRISKVTYPSGFAVAYSYNATGYQFKLANAATAQVYWTADSRDAELHLTQQTAGNGVVTQPGVRRQHRPAHRHHRGQRRTRSSGRPTPTTSWASC